MPILSRLAARPLVALTPTLDWINLLEGLTELRKLVYSLDCQFITKDFKNMNQKPMKRYIGEVLNEGTSVSTEKCGHRGKCSGSLT